MTRKCDITGKTVQSGHKVSHSNHKTKRRFLPNLQHVSLPSEILGQDVHMRVTANGIRTIEHNGGIDQYLLSTPNSRLSEESLKVKRKLKKAQEKKSA